MSKVAHLTTLHPAFDNRIFVRQCRSLARAGYTVVLIAPHSHEETVDAVTIRPIPQPRNRLDRLARQGFRVMRRALAEQADIYHFHDPDLLPWAWLLQLWTGRPVIYDVHEDYVTSLAQKPYLPRWLGRLIAWGYVRLEHLARGTFHVVIAERYYARRFPAGVPVLNYPEGGVADQLLQVPRVRSISAPLRLLYTGTVSTDRGALAMADLANRLPAGGSLTIIGACPPSVLAAMRARCPQPERLRVVGLGMQVPFSEIVAVYKQPWTAALALFPDTPHVREKELTKFFEYMAAGLPIVCSDFPVWHELMAGTGAGVCVPPGDPAAALAVVQSLASDPRRARAMEEAGRRAVRSGYTWDSQAAKLLELYESLAPRSQRPLVPAPVA